MVVIKNGRRGGEAQKSILCLQRLKSLCPNKGSKTAKDLRGSFLSTEERVLVNWSKSIAVSSNSQFIYKHFFPLRWPCMDSHVGLLTVPTMCMFLEVTTFSILLRHVWPQVQRLHHGPPCFGESIPWLLAMVCKTPHISWNSTLKTYLHPMAFPVAGSSLSAQSLRFTKDSLSSSGVILLQAFWQCLLIWRVPGHHWF